MKTVLKTFAAALLLGVADYESGLFRVLSAFSNSTQPDDYYHAFDNLVVAEAYVGKNIVMKRFASRARGRSSRIEKPFCEITIVVRELGEAA